MSRRISNNHTIVAGAWKTTNPKVPSRTRSNKARIYFAYPPVTGWKGGNPHDNGYRG